ncbi:MAG: carboxypeptidase-like regulatory domain-containing protein, partial [Muribaculaceae bacterium]|nr:carboxypeptidase-like regulatory domain-containing protein [Muribaculaceae bacterium]
MKLSHAQCKNRLPLLRVALAVLMGCFVLPALAQTVKVTGTVLSAEDHEPLIGASIRAQSGATAVTDADGAFTINAKKGQSIEFSYVG